MLDNDTLVYNLLLVIILLIGFSILFGKKPTTVLKFLFSPVIWLFGGIIKTGVFVFIGALGIYFVAGSNINNVVALVSSIFKSENTAPTPVPSPSPKPPVVSQPVSLQFSYPVGEINSQGLRKGEGWVVTQDFADEINPATPGLRGQHLGEDWQPTGARLVGEPVYAVAEGTIVETGLNNSFGYVVIIKHPLPNNEHAYVTSLYAHLIPLPTLNKGQILEEGKLLIGHIAAREWNGCSKGCDFTAPGCKPRVTGNICGNWSPHLHFELRTPAGGVAPGFGYSPNQLGFLNPTDMGSDPKNNGDGWIDAHYYHNAINP